MCLDLCDSEAPFRLFTKQLIKTFFYRHGHGDSHRRPQDLRDRLNHRNQGPRRRPKDRHRNRDRHGDRPQHSRPQESRLHKDRPDRPEHPERDRERDMRLQKLINATAAKAESTRDIEMKREKAAREKR